MEGLQVTDGHEVADVALEISSRVVGQPLLGGKAPIVDAWVAAAPDHRVEIVVRPVEAADLPKFQRKQLEQRGPARERLAYALKQGEVLGPGEDEAAGGRIVVDNALQVGEEVRRALDLVEYRPLAEAGEEAERVIGGELPLRRRLERDVGTVRERHPGEGRLARLPRARHRDDRIPTRGAFQKALERALDHCWTISTSNIGLAQLRGSVASLWVQSSWTGTLPTYP